MEPGAALLHLKDSLKESAEDCGRAANMQAVYATIRARFGLSPGEARSRFTERFPYVSPRACR